MNKSITVLLKDGGEYRITPGQIAYWQMIYTDLNIVNELNYLKTCWEIGAFPRKTAKSVNKYINKYLHNQSKEDL